MKGSVFLIMLIYCIINYIYRLYIDSPDWVKNKKTTINSINKTDNKCFEYAVTVASQRITKN